MERRHFIKSTFIAEPLVSQNIYAGSPLKKINEKKLKLSLNAYSFNSQLENGNLTLFDLIDFCKICGLEAVDPTGYYFPGYPNVPDDSYIYEFKRKAFLAGLEISGTGVRNDFANVDGEKRRADLRLIEDWCSVASKLGAPLLRVFAGKEIMDGRDKKKVMKQVITELKKHVG